MSDEIEGGSEEDWLMREQKSGGEEEDDLLLNPAHALVGTYGANRELANEFADWLGEMNGGQEIIGRFEVIGEVLYTRAPDQ
jgi:hypothetical protein